MRGKATASVPAVTAARETPHRCAAWSGTRAVSLRTVDAPGVRALSTGLSGTVHAGVAQTRSSWVRTSVVRSSVPRRAREGQWKPETGAAPGPLQQRPLDCTSASACASHLRKRTRWDAHAEMKLASTFPICGKAVQRRGRLTVGQKDSAAGKPSHAFAQRCGDAAPSLTTQSGGSGNSGTPLPC